MVTNHKHIPGFVAEGSPAKGRRKGRLFHLTPEQKRERKRLKDAERRKVRERERQDAEKQNPQLKSEIKRLKSEIKQMLDQARQTQVTNASLQAENLQLKAENDYLRGHVGLVPGGDHILEVLQVVHRSAGR